MPVKEWSDTQLLHDRDDPEESFSIVYRRHAAAILRFVASRGVDIETAADIVGDTFVAVLVGRYGFRGPDPSARLWVLGIAARKLADVHRRRAREYRRQRSLIDVAITLTAPDRDSYELVAARSESPAIAALGDLPGDQQLAIRARIVDDRQYREIAEALGLTEQATRKRVSRGLAAIRLHLERNR